MSSIELKIGRMIDFYSIMHGKILKVSISVLLRLKKGFEDFFGPSRYYKNEFGNGVG